MVSIEISEKCKKCTIFEVHLNLNFPLIPASGHSSRHGRSHPARRLPGRRGRQGRVVRRPARLRDRAEAVRQQGHHQGEAVQDS